MASCYVAPNDAHDRRAREATESAAENRSQASNTAKSINDPGVPAEQLFVRLQVLSMRDFTSAGLVLDCVQGIQRKLSHFRQLPGQRRFAAPSIPEDSNLSQMTASVIAGALKAPNACDRRPRNSGGSPQ